MFATCYKGIKNSKILLHPLYIVFEKANNNMLLGVSLDEVVGAVETQFTGLAEVAKGWLALVHEQAGDAAIVVGLGELGLQLDGAGVGCNGFVVVVELNVDVAHVVVGKDHVGFEFRDTLEVGKGLTEGDGGIPLAARCDLGTAHLGMEEVADGHQGLQLDGTVEVGEAGFEVAQMVVVHGAAQVESCGFRRIGEDFGDCGHVGKVLLYAFLAGVGLGIGDVEWQRELTGLVELLHRAMEGYEA